MNISNKRDLLIALSRGNFLEEDLGYDKPRCRWGRICNSVCQA